MEAKGSEVFLFFCTQNAITEYHPSNLSHSVSAEHSWWGFGAQKAIFRPLTFVDQSGGSTQSSDADMRQ